MSSGSDLKVCKICRKICTNRRIKEERKMNPETFASHCTSSIAETRSSSPFQLESTLPGCQERAALITVKRDSYVHFIDDMKNDLDCLSCQMTRVQEQLNLEEPASSRIGGGDGDGFRVMGSSKPTVVDDRCVRCGDCVAKAELADEEKTSDWWIQLHQIESKARLKLIYEMARKIEEHATAKSCSELEKNSEAFQSQIDQLQDTVCQKEKRIKHLNCMLVHLSHRYKESQPSEDLLEQQNKQQEEQDEELQLLRSQIVELKSKNESLLRDLERRQHQEGFLISETQKLNNELFEVRRKNSEMNAHTCHLATLLQSQEHHRMDLSQKYCQMKENYEEQSRKLRCARTKLSQLQDRYMTMEQRNDEHNMERNLLREEVLALKEKEADMLGRHKSIQEQMIKIDKELFTAHDVIKEQQCILQRNDTTHAELVKRAVDAANDTKRQFNQLVEDYNTLQEEYEKQHEAQQQNEKVLESFRRWKDAQLRSDESTRISFKQYEDHIKLLLEEKQNFLEKYRELKRDYCIIQNEVERLRCGTYSHRVPSNISTNSIENRIELIRRTSRRISEKSTSLRNGDGTSSGVRLSRSKSAQNLLECVNQWM